MNLRFARGVVAASALALGAATAAPVVGLAQQTLQAGTSGSVQGKDISVSTHGSGTTTTSPTGSSIGVTGGGTAAATDGSAAVDANAQINDRRGMQNSTATARDEDERATSRTRTMVREGRDVRSRTTTRYHQKGGGAPDRTSVYTVTNPDGTTTTRAR